MADILSESTLNLTEVTNLLPRGRNGSKPHFSTVLRWILTGAKSPTGETIKLEAYRLGGKWITSREALVRFMERLTPQSEDAPPLPRTRTARRRAAERAEADLIAKGS